jgi:hypothetical protein
MDENLHQSTLGNEIMYSDTKDEELLKRLPLREVKIGTWRAVENSNSNFVLWRQLMNCFT